MRDSLTCLRSLAGEFRAKDEGPVVEPLANDVGAQLIGRSLQGGHVVDRQKGVVILAEANFGVSELMLDEAVAVEVVRGSEREERGHTHHHRTEHFVVDVEIVVGEAAPLVGEDAVVGVLGGIFLYGDAEGWVDLHALENEVYAVSVLSHHSALPAAHEILLANALLGPFNGDATIAGEGLNPILVAVGALA